MAKGRKGMIREQDAGVRLGRKVKKWFAFTREWLSRWRCICVEAEAVR